MQYDDSVAEEYADLVRSILEHGESVYVRYVIFHFNQINGKNIGSIKKPDFEKKLFIDIPGEEGREIDFYDLKYLRKYFREFVNIKANPTHRYFVLGWGHGAGLGLFAHLIEEKLRKFLEKKEVQLKNVSLKKAIDTIIFYQRLKGQLSLSINEDTLEKLHDSIFFSNKEYFTKEQKIVFVRSLLVAVKAEDFADVLRNEITSGYKKYKVSVLLFLNCYTQMFETGYALHDVVKQLIAPQTTVPFYGYNYIKLFSLLSKNPHCTEDDISNNITNYYMYKYLEQSDVVCKLQNRYMYKTVNVKDDVAINSIELANYDLLLRSILEFITGHIRTVIRTGAKNDLYPRFETAHKRCKWMTGISDYGIIDFNHFIDELAKNYTEPDYKNNLKEVCQRFTKLKEITVIASYNSGKLYEIAYRSPDLFSPNPQFFSIFFPSRGETDFKKLLLEIYSSGSQQNIGFYKVSHWDNLIFEYLL